MGIRDITIIRILKSDSKNLITGESVMEGKPPKHDA